MTSSPRDMPSPDEEPAPPVRRPILFYATVLLAFSLLGGAVLALNL